MVPQYRCPAESGRPHNQKDAPNRIGSVRMWRPYILAAAAAGHDPAWLESPRVSFWLVLLSTIESYADRLLTVLAILTPLRPLRKQA